MPLYGSVRGCTLVLFLLLRPREGLCDMHPHDGGPPSTKTPSFGRDTHRRTEGKLDDPAAARRFVEASNVSLAAGSVDCPRLAKFYKTLGALAKWHSQRANEKNVIECRAVDPKRSIWECKAAFVYTNPKASEEEFSLDLRFRVEGSEIKGLECSMAG
jgi:hypothetical protein